jgi:hypothetical protein
LPRFIQQACVTSWNFDKTICRTWRNNRTML